MSKKRYREHVWHVRENYRLVWDSVENKSTEAIKKEIELCGKFKIALLDSEGVWNIHPVDLPMYYTESGRFELKTVIDEYPMFFRYPGETSKLLISHQEFFDTKPSENIAIRSEAQAFYTFYSLSSDGTYYNLFDIPRGTTQKYRRLKVFVNKGATDEN